MLFYNLYMFHVKRCFYFKKLLEVLEKVALNMYYAVRLIKQGEL